MRLKSIKSHLRPYVMLARRRTTINHAFAAAVAPSDGYDEEACRTAMLALGLNPDGELECAYCGSPAETWDHIFATVKNSRFSGHGHRLGNLLPCCKPCNSRKGNKGWAEFLAALGLNEIAHAQRSNAISTYIAAFSVKDTIDNRSPEHLELEQIRLRILALLEQGDQVAERIRAYDKAGLKEI